MKTQSKLASTSSTSLLFSSSSVINFCDTPGINDLQRDVALAMRKVFAITTVAVLVIGCGDGIKPNNDMVERIEKLRKHCSGERSADKGSEKILVCLTKLDANPHFNPERRTTDEMALDLADMRNRFAQAFEMDQENIALVSLGGNKIRKMNHWNRRQHEALCKLGVLNGDGVRSWLAERLVNMRLVDPGFEIILGSDSSSESDSSVDTSLTAEHDGVLTGSRDSQSQASSSTASTCSAPDSTHVSTSAPTSAPKESSTSGSESSTAHQSEWSSERRKIFDFLQNTLKGKWKTYYSHASKALETLLFCVPDEDSPLELEDLTTLAENFERIVQTDASLALLRTAFVKVVNELRNMIPK